MSQERQRRSTPLSHILVDPERSSEEDENALLQALFNFSRPEDGDGDGDGDEEDSDDGSDPFSTRRYARRLRLDDQERLTMRHTVRFLMETYNEWHIPDWARGNPDIFESPEDIAIQQANTNSIEEYQVPKNPADPVAVRSLERVKATEKECDHNCPICLGEIAVDATIISASTCVHYMHESCATEWFGYGNFCATCRLPVCGVKIDT